MTVQLKPRMPTRNDESAVKKRSAWRQRLVDTERGFTAGFRSDSTFFVHFFIGTVVLVTAAILGLHTVQWGILILSLTVVLSAEMFHQVLKTILHRFGHHFQAEVDRAMRIACAAVFVTILGAVLTIGLIFGERLSQLFGP